MLHKIFVVTMPYQTLIIVNGDYKGNAPKHLEVERTFNISTATTSNDANFDHWEIGGKEVSRKNPTNLTLPSTKKNEEVEVLAVFKLVK